MPPLRHHAARVRHHLKNTFLAHKGNGFRPHAFRPAALRVYAYLLIGTKVGVAMWVGLIANPAKVSSITSINIIEDTNQARVAQKLPPLNVNSLLTKAAQAKAQDMIAGHYFAHISPSNVTPWTWFKKSGYNYKYAGENLAIDFTQSEDVIQAWLSSPSHRKNLLSANYTDIGVAVATGEINGQSSLFVVQMFGAPAAIPKKVAAKPAATPPVAKKTAPAPTPAPIVLGDTTPTTPKTTPVLPPAPLAVPVISTPANQALLASNAPIVSGQSTPGTTVTLNIDGQAAGQTTADQSGSFSVQPSEPVADGSHTLSVQAQNTAGQTSTSAARSFSLDTSAPTINHAETFLLPSWLIPGTYDVSVQVAADTTTAVLQSGTVNQSIPLQSGTFFGQVHLDHPGLPPATVSLMTADRVGNTGSVVLIDPDLLTNGAVSPDSRLTLQAFTVALYSRTSMVFFLFLALALTVINVSRHWRRLHHMTILGTLAIIYLAGALIMI